MNVQHTFKVSREGDTVLLSAQEYPYLNCQVVPLEPQNRELVMERLQQRGWVATSELCHDFAMIHVGGGPKLNVTQENSRQVIDDMKECLRQAAGWWARHRE